MKWYTPDVLPQEETRIILFGGFYDGKTLDRRYTPCS